MLVDSGNNIHILIIRIRISLQNQTQLRVVIIAGPVMHLAAIDHRIGMDQWYQLVIRFFKKRTGKTHDYRAGKESQIRPDQLTANQG